MKRILELGTYIIPAYAGMILTEQGHPVVKWASTRPDPVLGLDRGVELWAWLNVSKRVITRHAREVTRVEPGEYDLVIDNIRASTWQRWGVDPATEAERIGACWVSMRDDVDPHAGRSFDAIAQARAWGDHIGYLPIYIGDTAGGLWLAYKALAAAPGHHVLYQATCLAKLVEGELIIRPDRSDQDTPPWDQPGAYGRTPVGVQVEYRGEKIIESFRDDDWRLQHLQHRDGRLRV